MRRTEFIMGMPVTIAIADDDIDEECVARGFAFFKAGDSRFSTYRTDSEISLINAGELAPAGYSADMRRIFALAEQTRIDTFGYFDIRRPDGTIDPSGLVKGWAIAEVALLLGELGCRNYFVDAGGDVQTRGRADGGGEWSVGIQNPFDPMAMVKVVYPHGGAVATSGNYVRGAHIYDPLHPGRTLDDLASITVIGGDIYDADRYATAAFAMGAEGIRFIESLAGVEGYAIDSTGTATMTSGFRKYATPC